MSLPQGASLYTAETTGSSLLGHTLRGPAFYHCFSVIHNHVAFQADLHNVSLLCLSQQLLQDSAVTNQICLLGLAELSYRECCFKVRGLALL